MGALGCDCLPDLPSADESRVCNIGVTDTICTFMVFVFGLNIIEVYW